MQRFFLIFLIFLSGTVLSYAQVAPAQTELHVVKKGETLYHLSQIYNTTVSHLLDLNPAIVDNKLKTGASVKVPKASTEVALKEVKIGPPHYLNPIVYKVNKGETLYSISKKSNTEVETVRMWNDLKNDDIKAGQKIIVGYTSSDTDPKVTKAAPFTTATPAAKGKEAKPKAQAVAKTTTTKEKSKPVATTTTPVPVAKTQPQLAATQTAAVPVKAVPAKTTPPAVAANTKTPATITATTPAATPVPTKYELNPNKENGKLTYQTEKGVATWSKGNNDDGQFYALHPTAPVGTIITVKNMMNSSSVQVKVIGKLPNTAENQNVMIKLSGSAAKQLNVLDDKFLATINYMGYKPETTSMK